jgi:cell division protein FtsI/penicillin-binding protein 2
MLRLAIALAAAALLAAAPVRPPGPAAVDLSRKRLLPTGYVAPAGASVAALTLDPALQYAAERLLQEANPVAGAVVVVDARRGRVLVWAERRRDGRGLSVITTTSAPAASVFKLVTTAALYEAAKLTPSERVCISGGSRAIERRHLDPPRSGDIRCAPFFQALGHSKNAVFAQLATHRLLRTDLIETAERIGFNGTVPFELPVPVGTLEVPYNDLEFARTAAGFRGTTLTPLGGAYLAGVIANGGISPRFRIIDAIDGEPVSDPTDVPARLMGSITAHRLQRMMEVTVESGTARSAFHDELGNRLLGRIAVSGKTGTLHPSESARDGAASWFIGFAPARSPTVIVSVLLENGGVWRRKAAEVARDVLRAYFSARGAAGVRPPLEIAER